VEGLTALSLFALAEKPNKEIFTHFCCPTESSGCSTLLCVVDILEGKVAITGEIVWLFSRLVQVASDLLVSFQSSLFGGETYWLFKGDEVPTLPVSQSSALSFCSTVIG